MEILRWAHGEGQTIQLSKEEAKELKFLIDRALQVGTSKSGFIDTKVEIIKEK